MNDGRDVNERQPPRDQGVLLSDDGFEVFVEAEGHRNVDPVTGENGILRRRIFGSFLIDNNGGFNFVRFFDLLFSLDNLELKQLLLKRPSLIIGF